MRITVTRIDARRYSTLVERDDRVRLAVPGYAFMRPLPHDLAHYVVESALGVTEGFWGSVAAGAKFPGMILIAGRQKPHAEEKSKSILKANAEALSESERLVACFERIVDERLDRNRTFAERLLQEATAAFHRPARCRTWEVLTSVCAAWRDMQARWDALPVDGNIQVEWSRARAGK
jgi:hypothetical protein